MLTSRIFRLALEITFLPNKYFFLQMTYQLLSQKGGRGSQGRSQNIKEVPQNFTEVFSIDNVTANDVIQRNQHRKEKKNKLEFHSNH